MPDEQSTSNVKYVVYILVGLLVILVAVLLLRLNKSESNTSSTQGVTSQNSAQPATQVDSLITYTLPSGWSKTTCDTSHIVYLMDSPGTNTGCSAKATSPISLAIDAQQTTDCNQLKGYEHITRHVCSSMFIDGHKTLKSSTTYNDESVYHTKTTLNDYYLDTGKGVVKVEYTYTTDNKYQPELEQLMNSIKVKG
jgi:hypothetical protein